MIYKHNAYHRTDPETTITPLVTITISQRHTIDTVILIHIYTSKSLVY